MSDTLEFLRTLWPDDDQEGWLVLCVRSTALDFGAIGSWDTGALNIAAGEAVQRDGDVWFSAGLQLRPPPPPKRGEGKGVIAIPGVWADIDWKGDAHSGQLLPENEDEAWEIVRAVGLEPTLVVRTGNGLQPWWLFDRPWVFEEEDEQDQARDIVARMGTRVQDAARGLGRSVDSVFDINRVMRLPGTHNSKGGHLVHVAEGASGARYRVADLAAWLPQAAPQVSSGGTGSPGTSAFSTDDADLSSVEERCAWMRHCRDEAATLPQDHWYYQLSVITRCDDALNMVHERSRPYPDYDPTEAEATAARSHRSSGPIRCDTVERKFGSTWCDGCAYRGSITTPVQLGRPPYSTTTAGQLPPQGGSSPAQSGSGGSSGPPSGSSPSGLVTAPQGRRRIAIDVDETDPELAGPLLWRAMHLLVDDERLYRTGNLMIRIVRAGDGGWQFEEVTRDGVSYLLSAGANFYKNTQQGLVDRFPPKDHIIWVMQQRPPSLSEVTRIVESPVFGPDGKVQTEYGYHASSRTFYVGQEGEPVPDVPDDPPAEWVKRARSLLLDELLVDFPFVDDASRAHAVALLLLPFVRDLVHGPTPIHLVDKPRAGTGASLLAEVCSLVSQTVPARMTPAPHDDDEWRKLITAKLRDGEQFIVFDNVTALESEALMLATTGATFSSRVLGRSETISLPVRCAWVATGNNPRYSTEAGRRTVRIALDAKLPAPWLRSDFRHDPLQGWVKENRGLLVAAVHTLVKHWLARGKPDFTGRTLASFEEWSRVVGGILETAGIPGFLDNFDAAASSDTDEDSLEELIEKWWSVFGDQLVSTQQLQPIAMESLWIDERTTTRQMGQMLSRLRDTVHPLPNGSVVTVHRQERRWALVPEG